MSPVPGTRGYAQRPEKFAKDYESVSFEKVHKPVIRHYPIHDKLASILDIGAGTGRDAAALARAGHFVDAVEPTAGMRENGQQLHANEQINWIDDNLPHLHKITASHKKYDLLLLTAVWMHLTPAERETAMTTCKSLLLPQGVISLSLRHGPVPPDRHMFDVPDEEVIALGKAHGLQLLHHSVHKGDTLGRNDIHWSYVVFSADASSQPNHP
ncbi:class I SAM-dependent methyltransferase [Advenella sp. WQ 585]|uniref:Class I SAM-dependent methyltransferase n=1 Tax=Advenella mandrilli TaxID=2800330 RepID=A0ABS1EAT7_9BURK|nr:class I SAM-dependent methyltransferase [Advenella mandrilli]MBK1780050.1 class I SAM-dependent methyltransferase [Advenella mandrilli]